MRSVWFMIGELFAERQPETVLLIRIINGITTLKINNNPSYEVHDS